MRRAGGEVVYGSSRDLKWNVFSPAEKEGKAVRLHRENQEVRRGNLRLQESKP